MRHYLVFYVGILSFFFHGHVHGQLSIVDLRVEQQHNPLVVESTKPVFSWKLNTGRKGTVQQSYEIRIGKDPKHLRNNKSVLWHDSKNSDESVSIVYGGDSLQSGMAYYWQVRVKDNHGQVSAWSEINHWRMALKPEDWTAQWIAIAQKDTGSASPLFRKTYEIKKTVKSATAYIAARGLYEAYVNGTRIGDAFLTPGWTSYKHRIQYQAYDISSLLKKGDNSIAATLGDGWYRGRIGFSHQRAFYGDTRALLLQIMITYTDGSMQILGSGSDWKTSVGPILASDIYDGETYDSRLEKTGWQLENYKEDHSWKAVWVHDYGFENLIGTRAPLVKAHEVFRAQRTFRTPEGDLVVDFGQNLVGWATVRASGQAGSRIRLSHAEVLDKAGNFYTANLRSAKQQNNYILNGSADQLFSPHFSFQGFRYVKIEGYPGELTEDDINAVAIYSDMAETGQFACSHPLINQLHKNIVWGQKGNFVDVPTDCPQRDERLGWTGDAQAFFRTAAYNMDVQAFFRKWLEDVKADQHANGSIPFVIPDVLLPTDAGSAGWGDVATIVPWDMYQAYGDIQVLENQYESMKAWVEFIRSQAQGELWNRGSHFGDWLFYRPADDTDGRAAVTDKHLIAQCFYAHSTQILANTAALLEKKEDERTYNLLLDKIKSAFQNEYLTPNGRLVSSTQTAYVLALQFDMLPTGLRPAAAQKLVDNIRSYGNHLTTGFLGTPYLCHVLSRFGYTDVAYDLLLQESYPSWLYPVKMGATTIWERWDGIKPDGSFQTDAMNSYNHYAYGAIGDWMYQNMAGIIPAAPGYKKIRIAPQPGGDITAVQASLNTVYGDLSSAWHIKEGLFQLEVTIPANTKAQIILPGTHSFTEKDLEIGSGTYIFKSRLNRDYQQEGN